MLELLIVILIILWLSGAVGWRGRRWGRGNNLVHLLLVLAVIVLLFRVLR